MFDPPDFPYKELTETLDNYGPDDIFFHNDTMVTDSITNDRDLVKVTETIISTVENQLSFSSNISGESFNVEAVSTLNIAQTNNEQNLELYVVQSENLFNYEPTLLDDNTVNQFLLPIQESSDTNKEADTGPDLLALHSCVICHEIFTTDAELLDHTVLAHATVPSFDQEPSTSVTNTDGQESSLECEWLVCGVCERVLSTALDSQPRELLCCTDTSDKSTVGLRKMATMFVCDYCSYLFANGEALERHRLACFGHEDYYPMQMDNPILESAAPHISEYPCCVCGKQCANGEELRCHTIQCQPPPRRRRPYSTGNTNKMWNCGSCNQLFTTARELYRHKRGEDRPSGAPLMAYVCEECDKVLGSMCALHTHKKMHKVSKPGYPCRVCGRRFNQSGHLAIHMRMHTGERPYPCDLCDKAFKVKVERDDHRRTHTGERPFACAACSKTFTAAARLREHARIHTDQRPYKCDICGAAFRRPYARTVHTLIHTGEKPHECDVCGTAFRRSGDMWKHKRTLHGIQGANGETH